VEDGVQEELDLGLVPVQLGRDRVDEVRHVVDDDVHDQVRTNVRMGVGAAGFTDLHQGTALRPAPAELGVGLRHRRHPGRRGQVLGRDALIVSPQVADDVTASVPRHLRIQAGLAGPGFVRLDQEGFPDLIAVAVCRHRVHSFVSTNLIRRLTIRLTWARTTLPPHCDEAVSSCN
jgi:hypothetical protein